MVKIKKDSGNADIIYPLVLKTLSIDHFDKNTRKASGRKVAKDLVNTLDRLERIDYEKIPTKVERDFWIYTKRNVKIAGKLQSVEISLSRDDSGLWRFSKETSNTINYFAESLKNKKVLKSVVNYSDWKTRLKTKMPEWTGKRSFIL